MSTATQPIPYAFSDVPPSGEDGRSRFALPASPSGQPLNSTAHCCLLNWQAALAAQGVEDSESEPIEFVVHKLVKTVEETYAAVPVKTLRVRPTGRNRRPSKFSALKSSGGQLIDELLLRSGPGWDRATDAQVYEAACAWATREAPEPRWLTDISRTLAVALLRRCGVEANPLSLI